MREIVFDTETTGREPEGGDRIVEIGCVELINLSPTGRTLHLYLNPERDVPDEVVRVHGLTGAFLRDKPLFTDVAAQIIEFFADAPLVAHNAEFDRGFINAEFARLGMARLPSERFVDTLQHARKRFPGAANSLDALSKRFQLDRYGFDLAGRKGPGGHGALLDAKMLAEVYLQLMGGREQRLAFDEESASARPDGAQAVQFTRRPARARPLASRLTADEAEAHARFIDTLGAAALWLKFKAS
jgi:DNA polymerase III subunit epsilon